MTITEKIIAAHAHRDAVRPGEIVNVEVDLCLGNDLSTNLAIDIYQELGLDRVYDPDRIVLVMDHYTPARDIASAQLLKKVREWARKMNVRQFYGEGLAGIEHVVLVEEGLVRPGMLVTGGDSHTTTYGALGCLATGVGSTDMAATFATGETWLRVPETTKLVFKGEPGEWVSGKDLILYAIWKQGVAGAIYRALEYTGETIDRLSVTERLTMANMAIEMGAKNGICYVDQKTREFLAQRTKKPYTVFEPDEDAHYNEIVFYDVSGLDPIVAVPSLPGNGRPISEIGDVHVDQVVIGTCTNGRIEDLRTAARILKGRRVAAGTRVIVIPGSQSVQLQMSKEGLMEAFLEAGCVVSTSTCGPCIGGHMGVVAADEVCLSTTNRNFVGRMGHKTAKIYLASPAVAAASAVTGKITHPREVAGRMPVGAA